MIFQFNGHCSTKYKKAKGRRQEQIQIIIYILSKLVFVKKIVFNPKTFEIDLTVQRAEKSAFRHS